MIQELFAEKGYGVNELSHLTLRDVDLYELGKLTGDMPLHVLDEVQIRQNISDYQRALKDFYPNESKIFFASKSNQNLAVCHVMEDAGICLDVCSLGEMHIASKANFPFERILLHGNNKTEEEILYALQRNIGFIIVDNESEYALINKVCSEHNLQASIMLRLNPNQSTTTHKYVDTSRGSCQFGMIFDEHLMNLADDISGNPNIHFKGLHMHLGSQLGDSDEVSRIFKKFIQYCKIFNDRGLECEYINIGGGKAIQYEYKAAVPDIYNFMKHILQSVVSYIENEELKLPKLMIEPGRSIIGDAGCTIYKIGSIKNSVDKTIYAAVCGGMSDNIRPALYNAKYTAMDPTRPFWAGPVLGYKIVGRCCESGDVLIDSINLPELARGDYLVVFSTGAYVSSMASNYNKNCFAGTILVNEEGFEWIAKPQPIEDLANYDIVPERFAKAKVEYASTIREK